MKDSLLWETTKFSGRFVQVSLYYVNLKMINLRLITLIMNPAASHGLEVRYVCKDIHCTLAGIWSNVIIYL